MAAEDKEAAAPSARRVLTASLVGTAVEFYDFYIYTTAASLVFGPLFFPTATPSGQLLRSFMTVGIAFLARPIGAMVFGHFGDRVGRKSTLFASLLTMGLSTFAIAFIPTQALAGWLAVLLLCALRFGQGFGLGGEWGGAALLAVEHAPPGWRARYGMFPQLGAPVGFLAANGLFLVLGAMLSPQQFLDWGWRVPFLLSLILVALGLWVRLKLCESPAFAAACATAPPPAVPLAELIRNHGRVLLGSVFAAIACFAVYYIATAFALGYGTAILHYDRQQFLCAQLFGIVFMAAGILAAGWLSDRFSERAVLMAGCAGSIGAGFLLAPLLGSGSMAGVVLFLAILLTLMGFAYGPLGGWLPSRFPTRVRYTGASMAFNLAGILGGGLTPFVAQQLADNGGLPAVGLYLSGAALLSLIALALLRTPRAAG